jgi:hypothetical protein
MQSTTTRDPRMKRTKAREGEHLSADGLATLDKEYPLIMHTRAGRLYSTVRRMKAEKELNVPIERRTGFAISVKTGKAANKMSEREWETFYSDLSDELKRDYPDLYARLFAV